MRSTRRAHRRTVWTEITLQRRREIAERRDMWPALLMERSLLHGPRTEVEVEGRLTGWLKRLALWQVGLLIIGCAAFLYVDDHWLSGRHKSHLVMLPMVSLEQFGIFGMALGGLIVIFGLVRAAFPPRRRA